MWLRRLKVNRRKYVPYYSVGETGKTIIDDDYLDRLVAVADAVDDWSMCLAMFPCTEGHRPEDGTDYLIHDITCPFHDDWKP